MFIFCCVDIITNTEINVFWVDGELLTPLRRNNVVLPFSTRNEESPSTETGLPIV